MIANSATITQGGSRGCCNYNGWGGGQLFKAIINIKRPTKILIIIMKAFKRQYMYVAI